MQLKGCLTWKNLLLNKFRGTHSRCFWQAVLWYLQNGFWYFIGVNGLIISCLIISYHCYLIYNWGVVYVSLRYRPNCHIFIRSLSAGIPFSDYNAIGLLRIYNNQHALLIQALVILTTILIIVNWRFVVKINRNWFYRIYVLVPCWFQANDIYKVTWLG